MASNIKPSGEPRRSNDPIEPRDTNPDPITGAPGSHPAVARARATFRAAFA